MKLQSNIAAAKTARTTDSPAVAQERLVSGFFIVNRHDRPSEDYIAERRKDGFLYYVHPKLRNDKRFWAMNPDDPTPLEDFGIRIRIENGELHGKLVDPSRATYLDGRARRWQGEDEFSFYYPNVKSGGTPTEGQCRNGRKIMSKKQTETKPADAEQKSGKGLDGTICYASVPPMHITTTPNVPGIPDLHHLKGWDDLDLWGRCNHPHWAAIQRRTEWAAGMSEIDKLRLLAGEMLRLNVEHAERNLEMVHMMPVPPISIPSHTDKGLATQPAPQMPEKHK